MILITVGTSEDAIAATVALSFIYINLVKTDGSVVLLKSILATNFKCSCSKTNFLK